MWINCRTEYTFKQVYGHLDQVAAKCASLGSYAGIADANNTFGHIKWRKACKEAGIKPIYGVRLAVVEDLELREIRHAFNYMTLIAKTQEGLQKIYWLVDQAHLQFYYRPRISYDQLNDTTDDIIVLSGVAPNWDLITREVYFELGPNTPFSQRKPIYNIPSVACIDNFYPNYDDKIVYEPFADDRLRETKTYPLHILSKEEWLAEFPGREDALKNLDYIAEQCNVELPNAPMVKYIGNDDIVEWCKSGAKLRGLDIISGKYAERYDREIKLIIEKDYADYFLVVADLIRYAKTKMAVGASRGSSAGSLVCYLMNITEVDPLEYDLYFERFIDVNRFDLPDIDIDFQDDKRHLVIKYLEKKYGKDNVAQIGNISKMKPKSAIARFAKALNVPLDDVEELKDAIMERSGGDARANLCISDSFTDTEVGKRFIEKYPIMNVVGKIESHALHTGVHAAGILVCNDPISSYAGVNSRKTDGKKQRIAMLDKKDAEAVNLLKIDALGLRTLSILAGVCDQLGKPYGWLYDIPLDDQITFDVFNNRRYNGIFQFEGQAIASLAKKMTVEDMEDISALGALGRPGPLSSGSAAHYIWARTGVNKVEYLSEHQSVIDATEKTFGTIIYQEQVMAIGRNFGGLSWKDLDTLRRAMAKSLGEEFFNTFKEKFIKGAAEKGIDEKEAKKVWAGISTMGCLSGETLLQNPFPNHVTPKYIKLKDLYKNDGYVRKKNKGWDIIKKQQLYCMVDDKIKPQRLLDVIESGVKTTYELILESGESIRATSNHKFFTKNGWVELAFLVEGDEVAIMGKRRRGTANIPFKGTGSGAHNIRHGEFLKSDKARLILNNKYLKCQECNDAPSEQMHHIDGNRMHNDFSNLLMLCRKCHKKKHREMDGINCVPHKVGKNVIFSKIVFIGDGKDEMTYDISMPEPNHNFIANNVVVHNSYSFNKSHSVAYGMISYLTAYMKGNHPLEFLVASLNHSRSDQSALKILRDAVEFDKVEYEYINKEISTQNWSVHDGKLYGGLKTIHGIGPAMANKIIKLRREGESFPKGIQSKLDKGISVFKHLYPAEEVYGDYYDDPKSHGLNGKVMRIGEAAGLKRFTVIGCLVNKNLRDANETCFVVARKGKYLTDQDTSWLVLYLEDDTGTIRIKIDIEKYKRLGLEIAETGKENKDWYMGYVERIKDWDTFFCINIMKITREP